MGKNKLKIFLAYHKDTPCYKSEIFQPIQVGAEMNDITIDFAIPDNLGDNISNLNPYYCELTGHYWVFKNYIDNCEEEYIGFAHYRRIPDIINISKSDTPSIFGCSYSESLTFFENMKNQDLTKYYNQYDILLPCTVYLYANTVNPILREGEPHYNMYDKFKIEHNRDLLDVLSSVIRKSYPDYVEALKNTFKKEKIHCFNTYIMKKEILKSYLEWEFKILEEVGTLINGWDQDKYLRMTGFVAESLINLWLEKNNSYTIGYFPMKMIDFEADYIIKANELHMQGKYTDEISVLKQYLDIASDKFGVCSSIVELYELLGDAENIKYYTDVLEKYSYKQEEYAYLARKYGNIGNREMAIKYYKKSIEKDVNNKFYAESYLVYAEATRDVDIIKNAWSYLLKYDLTDAEREKYTHFQEVYKMVKG